MDGKAKTLYKDSVGTLLHYILQLLREQSRAQGTRLREIHEIIFMRSKHA